MNSKRLSPAWLAIVLISLPILLSLPGCLPVPIGDPEKSRIDPDLSGMWIVEDEIYLFEPFDKRTWLLTSVAIKFDAESCSVIEEADDTEVDPYAELVARMSRYDESCFAADDADLFKVWRTKLGREWFMTWERKGGYDVDRGFAPELWYVFRIQKAGPDKFSLWMLDADYDGFADLKAYQAIAELDPPYDPKLLKKARREAERVIQRNVDDPKLYGESEDDADSDLNDDEADPFIRVRPEHHELFSRILEDAVNNSDK